jgi:rod shape-determining protein MreC
LSSRTGVWTLAVTALAVFLLALSRADVLGPLGNIVLTVFSPLQNALTRVSEPAADFISDIRRTDELSEENQALRAENERLNAEVARLRENETRLQQLSQLLQVKETHPEEQFLAANVFAREPSNVKEMVAIDRGKRDGVREGMAVVTEGGSLVGSITHVFDDYAWVTLITDPNSAVSAMIQESRAQGVVSGSYSRRLTMEFLRQAAVVHEGDMVLTSGIGGSFPPGLVIGRVSAVESSRQEIFKDVTVEPLASLSRLETVLVLTSFTPLQLQRP